MFGHRIAPALASVGLGCGILFTAPLAREIYTGVARPRTPSLSSVSSTPSTPPPARGELVARLTVSRLALDSAVLEGLEAGTLAKGAGHVPGTALPGEEKAAHPSVVAFARGRTASTIAGLRLGDHVHLTSTRGRRRYRVVERRIEDPRRLRLEEVSDGHLTLLAPFPPDFPGPAPMRLAVVLKGRD
jgi:sortase A